MRNLNVAIIVVILSIVVHTRCVGESEEGFEHKRFDLTLLSCMDNFDVHSDMIIRTQDSRAMGAKYLNEAEVNGRDECQKLCCETESCDVYVYEQKNPNSCYLFHCGSPEDFKCKFTQHRNYTSAILTLNNHLNELENQIKLTKHEEELNNLRKIGVLPDTTSPPMLTSTKVPDKMNMKTITSSSLLPLNYLRHSSDPASTSNTFISAKGSQCSRYQFECRGSGECIAIYNACDGIPQCSDGSDEAPELDCPTLAGTVRPKSSEQSRKTSEPSVQKVNHAPSQEAHQQVKSPAPQKSPTGWQQSPSSTGYGPGYGISQPNEKIPEFPTNPQKMDPQQQLAYQARMYGREGEALAQQYPLSVLWQGYPMQHQDEGSHIFTHKGAGLVSENSDRYSNRKDLPDRIHHGQIPGPFSSDLGRSDYFKFSATGMNGNGYYNGPVYYPNNMSPRQQQQQLPPQQPQQTQQQQPQQPQQQPQQQPHVLGTEEMPQRPGLGIYANGMSAPASDYYYEDSQLRARVPVLQDPLIPKNMENRLIQNQTPPKSSGKKPAFQAPSPVGGFEAEKPKMTESVKKTLDKIHYSSTSKIPQHKLEATTAPGRTEGPKQGVAAELKMNEEPDGGNSRPSGAILSLSLGMCITAIMIALVGCRLRVVRRRMRRGSKSPYADFRDADFLVNGMYL